MEDQNIIQVNNLTKNFGKFTAVDGISFNVKKGEIFGLLGPNGAGKSTTLRMLSTLSRPTKGTAIIGGFDTVKNDMDVRKLIGIVSEKMIIYNRLTAKENLWFFGSLFNIPKDTLNKRIDDLLELVQLTKWKNAQVGTFSTGMRQRMNVVRALLNMPQVLFLDEPTLGLDPQSSVEIRDFIKKLNQENGTTVIITTHMMVDADLLCDRIAIVDHGKIIALDTSTNLKKIISGGDTMIIKLEIANLTPELIASLKALKCADAITQENSTRLHLIVHGEEAFDNIIDAVREKNGKITTMENLQPSLEDVFLHITGHEVRDSADQKIPMEQGRRRFGAPSSSKREALKMTAQTILKHSYRIAKKDLTELFRNRLGLVLLIVMPLFMMVMVGFIYPSNGTITDLKVGLVNEDSGFNGITSPSQGFLFGLNQINSQTHMLSITNVSSTASIKDMVQKGTLEGGIIIPANFSRSLMTWQQGTIIIVSDESNPQISATIQAALTGVFNVMSQQLAIYNVAPLNATNPLAVVQPYSIQTQGVVSGHPSYFDFIAPGIMAMTVMMSVMTGLPVAISQEKEVGTMDGMMVAPVNRLSILLGKTMAQTGRGLIQGVIILALAIGIFGVAIQGSLLLVFALLLLGVFSFVGLGIVITSFTKDQETAQMFMMTLMFPMMFLSGVFFPIQQMPWYMQDISKALPLTYASDALRKVMVLGADISQISTDLIVLIVFGVVMIAIALPVFRRMMTR